MDCSHRTAGVRSLFVCAAWLSLATAASADLPWSRLDAVHPAGAKAGSSLQVRVTGSELEKCGSLTFSHPGIKATRAAGSSPAENLFDVQVAADVPAGLYDIAASGDFGLSNLRTFAVGTRTELSEAEPNEGPANATTVSVGSTINGRIGKATDVDSYSFRAAAGQMVIADCLATRIDSPLLPVLEILDTRGRRIAFARSGRADDAILVFEPAVEADYILRVYDQTYRGGDDFVYRVELHSDPYVAAVHPIAGQAGTTSKTQVLGFNLPGAHASDQRWGRWPLAQTEAAIEFPAERLSYDRLLPVTPREAGVDSFSWRFTSTSASSQPVRMAVSDVPPSREVEPNQHRDQAPRLELPADVSGSFGSIGDVDVFSVAVKKDEPIWIEVFAGRLGSKADPALRIDFLADGATEPTQIARVDDTPGDLLALGFETHSDDPAFRFQPTANGTCLIQVRDQYGQTRGDASLAYRLVVRRPQPDFRLVAVPTSKGIGMIAPASLRRGDAVEFTVVAFRQEGFDGAIEIPATELGGGLSTSGTVIPRGQFSARLVLRAEAEAAVGPRTIELRGRATTEGAAEALVRPLRPATTVRSTARIQNRDLSPVARLARGFVVDVANETAPIELRQELARQSVKQGGSFEVPLKLIRRTGAEGVVTVTVQGLPKPNIDGAELTFAAGETEKVVKITAHSDLPVQTAVINWIARTKVQYRRNTREREEGRLALENITGRLKSAMEEAKAAGPDTAPAAEALRKLEEERAAAEKRFQELDKQVQEIEVSAVTSPLVLDVEAVAATPGAAN